MTRAPEAARRAVWWLSPGFALGLVLIGLGVPRVVDAVEIAYALDIKRDVGVLPWYLLTIVGLALFARAVMKRERAPRGLALRVWLAAAALALIAFGVSAFLTSGLLDQLRTSGTATWLLALRGVALVSAGVGAIVAAIWRTPRG